MCRGCGGHGARLDASGLLIGEDTHTHSSQPFITGHSGPPISSLIVSGPSLLSTCNCPHPLACKGRQQTRPRGKGGNGGAGGPAQGCFHKNAYNVYSKHAEKGPEKGKCVVTARAQSRKIENLLRNLLLFEYYIVSNKLSTKHE